MVTRDEQIFNGDLAGYRLVMPGVMIAGLVDESYSIDQRQWHVVHTEGSARWEGKGDTKDQAYLSLLAVRLGLEPGKTPGPRRGDPVEAWIKRHRDECAELSPADAAHYGTHANPPQWHALDALLDDYRDHADTGTPLDLPVEGPHPDGEPSHADAVRERLDVLLAEAAPLSGGHVTAAISHLRRALARLDTEREATRWTAGHRTATRADGQNPT